MIGETHSLLQFEAGHNLEVGRWSPAVSGVCASMSGWKNSAKEPRRQRLEVGGQEPRFQQFRM